MADIRTHAVVGPAADGIQSLRRAEKGTETVVQKMELPGSSQRVGNSREPHSGKVAHHDQKVPWRVEKPSIGTTPRVSTLSGSLNNFARKGREFSQNNSLLRPIRDSVRSLKKLVPEKVHTFPSRPMLDKGI
jgi:hypothetical protein